MALRIASQIVGNEHVVALHGWLNRAELAEFENACAANPLPLCLDLKQLAGADPEGIIALKGLRAKGARIIGASPYIKLLLDGASGP
jgi:hypothetical protein